MRLTPVSYMNVSIKDSFWKPRMETNRTATIPHMFDLLESTNSIRNIELAVKHAHEGFTGPYWTDSDVYRAIEAASYTLASHPDDALESRIDDIISKVVAAQQPDGYINSYFQVVEPDAKFTDLANKHELYTAGHMFEAGVAYYEATGKRALLDACMKMADYIASIFGDAPEKRLGYPGHPEIELALVKLWRATGEPRYLDLAWFFLSNRGIGALNAPANSQFNSTFYMDDMPIRDHDQIKGHAVRALYLLTGVADILTLKDDDAMDAMLDRVWANAVGKRMYITGGMGPGGGIEGFTVDYDLPNLTAYQETCASVAMVMWSHRMGILRGKSKYFDVLERTLYNGALAGISLDGRRFFYTNPLASKGDVQRSEWFGCACCPPNISRLIASIGGYAYAKGEDSLWVNLYIGGKAQINLDGRTIELKVKTDYPWDGKIRIKVKPSSPAYFKLMLRIPNWCCGYQSLRVNGRKTDVAVNEDGYLEISRKWMPNDTVELHLPMRITRMEAHSNVANDRGATAIQRGPIVYCIEQTDHDTSIEKMILPYHAKLEIEWRPEKLGGIVEIKGKGLNLDDPSESLYREFHIGNDTKLTAIPYCLWNNREQSSAMRVWIPYCKYHTELG